MRHRMRAKGKKKGMRRRKLPKVAVVALDEMARVPENDGGEEKQLLQQLYKDSGVALMESLESLPSIASATPRGIEKQLLRSLYDDAGVNVSTVPSTAGSSLPSMELPAPVQASARRRRKRNRPEQRMHRSTDVRPGAVEEWLEGLGGETAHSVKASGALKVLMQLTSSSVTGNSERVSSALIEDGSQRGPEYKPERYFLTPLFAHRDQHVLFRGGGGDGNSDGRGGGADEPEGREERVVEAEQPAVVAASPPEIRTRPALLPPSEFLSEDAERQMRESQTASVRLSASLPDGLYILKLRRNALGSILMNTMAMRDCETVNYTFAPGSSLASAHRDPALCEKGPIQYAIEWAWACLPRHAHAHELFDAFRLLALGIFAKKQCLLPPAPPSEDSPRSSDEEDDLWDRPPRPSTAPSDANAMSSSRFAYIMRTGRRVPPRSAHWRRRRHRPVAVDQPFSAGMLDEHFLKKIEQGRLRTPKGFVRAPGSPSPENHERLPLGVEADREADHVRELLGTTGGTLSTEPAVGSPAETSRGWKLEPGNLIPGRAALSVRRGQRKHEEDEGDKKDDEADGVGKVPSLFHFDDTHTAFLEGAAAAISFTNDPMDVGKGIEYENENENVHEEELGNAQAFEEQGVIHLEGGQATYVPRVLFKAVRSSYLINVLEGENGSLHLSIIDAAHKNMHVADVVEGRVLARILSTAGTRKCLPLTAGPGEPSLCASIADACVIVDGKVRYKVKRARVVR
eukprot:g3363.t1